MEISNAGGEEGRHNGPAAVLAKAELQVLLLSLPSSSSVSFLSPGQIQEVPLSQKEPSPQVEVTPELDLEVVPESSTDWHVFH